MRAIPLYQGVVSVMERIGKAINIKSIMTFTDDNVLPVFDCYLQ